MNEIDVLEKVAKTSGKNKKRDILSSESSNQRLGELLERSMNFKRKYYVKDIPSYKTTAASTGGANVEIHGKFLRLLDRLETGDYRGDQGKKMVVDFLSQPLTDQERHWYTRVIKKDLKAGFSLDTAVKCGFDIPIFNVMLAKNGKHMKDKPEVFLRGLWASPKLDGYRCMAILKDGTCQLLSRNGTEYENFPSVKESLETMFPTGNYVLDGEIMSDSFNEMQQTAFASKRGTAVGDVTYNVFDYIPYNEWESQKFSTKKEDRLKLMYGIETEMQKHSITNIELIVHTKITTYAEIIDLEADYILMGYEGAMACPNIPYMLKRSTKGLLKFKTFSTQDCEIVGFYEGEADSKYKGMLGGLHVIQEDGVTCDCGGGFSDEEREYIWNNQSEFVGRIIECSFFELTEKGRMRHPNKIRWRDNGAGKGKR